MSNDLFRWNMEYDFGDRHSHNIQQKYVECPRNE